LTLARILPAGFSSLPLQPVSPTDKWQRVTCTRRFTRQVTHLDLTGWLHVGAGLVVVVDDDDDDDDRGEGGGLKHLATYLCGHGRLHGDLHLVAALYHQLPPLLRLAVQLLLVSASRGDKTSTIASQAESLKTRMKGKGKTRQDNTLDCARAQGEGFRILNQMRLWKENDGGSFRFRETCPRLLQS